MKKFVVLGVVTALALALACSAQAADPDPQWLVNIRAENSAGTASVTSISCGTKTGAIDAYTTVGSEDAAQPAGSGARGMITTDASTEVLVVKDRRAPLLPCPSSKTWYLTAWLLNSSGNMVAGNVTLKYWVNGAANEWIDIATYCPLLTVEVKKGTDVLFTYPRGSTGLGSATSPLDSDVVVFDGSHPVELQLVATCVPEPGSMLALMSGLVGLAGLAIRRRR